MLGQDGPLQFDQADKAITITGNGSVSTQNGEIGRIRIVTFDDVQTLNRKGQNLFEGENPQVVETPRLAQHSLETANVDAVGQISQMIQVQRAYEQLASMMTQQNDLRENAIQTLGRVQTNA